MTHFTVLDRRQVIFFIIRLPDSVFLLVTSALEEQQRSAWQRFPEHRQCERSGR